MELVTFAKFSLAHKFQVVSFVRCYLAYVDNWLPGMDNEHCHKIKLAKKEDAIHANAVEVVRDSSLKVVLHKKIVFRLIHVNYKLIIIGC